MLGIIGGSGIYSVSKPAVRKSVSTPYGKVQVEKIRFSSGAEAWFVSRHGKGHAVPPHKVNYKANVYALKKVGVDAVFATYAVGIISCYKLNDLILAKDIVSFNITPTYFDSFAEGIKHTNMCEPYSKKLSDYVYRIGKEKSITVKRGGIIFTTHGPRFETPAEIKAIKRLGANLVSMTAAYEVILANELELPFIGLALGTNYACGIKKANPSMEEVFESVKKAKEKINIILEELAVRV